MDRLILRQSCWIVPVLQFVLLAATSCYSSFYINHDAALYLQCGQLILEGKTPYVDFYDNNTPLIMYMSAVPVLISQISGFTVMQSFAMVVLIAILTSTLAIRRVMACNGISVKTSSIWISAWIFMNLMTQVFHDFGQREHLFIILATPFFFVRFSRIQNGVVNHGKSFLLAAGFFAGMGAALKPYFIVMILAGELALFVKVRNRSIWVCPEWFGFVLFGVLYALFFAFSPQIRTNYLEVLAPLISKGNSAYYAPASAIWNSFNPLHNKQSAYLFLASVLFCADILWVLIVVANQKKPSSGTLYLMVLAVMAFVSYLYQAKGWYYHMIPFEFLVVSVFVLNLSALFENIQRKSLFQKSFASWSLAGLLTLQLSMSGVFIWRMDDQGRYWNARFFEILQETPAENNRVLVVSSSLKAYPFLLQADKRPGSRFLWFFPMALLYSQSHNSNFSEAEIYAKGSFDKVLESRFLTELASDIETSRPAMIFMSSGKSDQGLPKNFTLKSYLKFHKINELIEKYYQLDLQNFHANDGALFDLWVLK
jgi:hypothetical protein